VLEIGGPGGPPFVWWRGQLKSKHKVPRLRMAIRKRIHPLLDLDLELQIPFDRAQRRLFLCCAYSHPQKIPAQAKLGRGTVVGFSSLTADPRSDRDDNQVGERGPPGRFEAEDPRPCKQGKDGAPAYR
jgi:hypothetical protein